MKVLTFSFRGEVYEVNKKGQIRANGLSSFSNEWIFLGGSRHHWSTHIDVSLKDAFNMPGLLDGCIGWDRDHGTLRSWRGSYYGKIPRISVARIVTR
jgi:hypothetical protein